MSTPWILASLAPLMGPLADGLVGDLPIELVVPDRDDSAAVAEALRAADLLIYDWRPAAPGLQAADIAGAPNLAFVQQPSAGVPGHDLAALAAAGIPLANAAGFNAQAVG